jgi:heat shock protein HslJ
MTRKTASWLVIGFLVVLIAIVGVAAVMARNNNNSAGGQTAGENPQDRADTQHLLIPRWFLVSMTVDGQIYEIPAGQQDVTIQFLEDGSVNGKGGCNQYFSTYEADNDGSMRFSPVGATKMFCDGWMDVETALFQALGQISRFSTEDYQLTMTSTDGQTTLVFGMPPK